MTDEELIELAIGAAKHSYAPYSQFHVGAVLLTKSGKVYLGCNVESVSFSPTTCAERTALLKAVSEGERDFCAIAIVGGKQGDFSDYCYPCGVCRQFLSEFCGDDFCIVLGGKNLPVLRYTLKQLLPHGFKAETR